jgi:serine/threonine-protein kinase Chk2
MTKLLRTQSAVRKKRQLKVSFGNAQSQNNSSEFENENKIFHKRSKNNNNEQDVEYFAILTSLNSLKYKDINIPYQNFIRIGRSNSKDNDIIITNKDCSSIHCEFELTRSFNNINLLTVKDLSSNGTFINATLIGMNNTSLLRDGDRISFASELHYIVRYNLKFKSKNISFYDKYILTNKILGTGHYAQVKEAQNRETGIVCAVKIFNPTNKGDQASQLNRELEILTNLNHPNIVGFYDTFLEPVSISSLTTYLVLEKVNGGELFNRIVRKGKLNQNETKEICKQLLNGLQYLHSIDIVHRDLKPENILLSIIPVDLNQKHNDPWDEDEYSVQVKIADFGLAKFIGKFQFTTTLCGTPAYVAPEVLANSTDRKYNKSVDMWSVGVLLYVCLCGFPPFSEELGPPSMRQQILEAKFAFYSPYWDDIDDVSLDLISRLLVVRPNERLTVDEAIEHAWFKNDFTKFEKTMKETPFNQFDDPIGYRARQLSFRVPSNARGYSCDPITLTERATTGLTDEIIAQKYCTFK